MAGPSRFQNIRICGAADTRGKLAHAWLASHPSADLSRFNLSGMCPVYFVGHPPGLYRLAPPPSPWVVWGKFPVFNQLAAGFYRKVLCFRSLEAKLLKAEGLYGPLRETEPGGMLWGARNT